jgi:type I restriction enzyme S subunit
MPIEKAPPSERFRYIDISSIDNEHNRIIDARELEPGSAPSRARQHVRGGDVVLSTVRTYLRNTAQVPNELDHAVASTGFCVLRAGPAIKPRFLFFRCLDAAFVNSLNALQTGSSYPAVRDRDVLDQAVGVPPLAEQERIVAAIEEQFSRLDAAETALRGALRRSSALSEASVRAAEQGETVPLRDLLVEPLVNGRSVPTATSGFPVLRLTALRDGRIDLSERKTGAWSKADTERFLVRRGDFFISRGNGSLGLVGRGGLLDVEPDDVAFPDTMIRARVNDARIDPRFLRIVWNGPQTRSQIEATARTTAGIYKVNQKDLERVLLPVPPFAQQREIVERTERQLTVLDALTAAVDQALARAAALRRAILSEAFAGRLVPQDPSDEPASVLLERIRVERAAAPKTKTRRA